MIRALTLALTLFAAIPAVLMLSNQYFSKGGSDARVSVYPLGDSARASDHRGRIVGDSAIEALRVSPALAWRKLPAVEVSGRLSQTRTLENDSEWVDPLLTHRIFSGRDGRVYISRDIAPDPEFWAGVGTVVLPDGSVITDLDKEFATTMWSVAQQESGWRCDAVNHATINGVTYEVIGMMQLLQDSAMRRLVAEMGYTREDLFRCSPNVLVAAEWKRLTDNGVEWRQWVAKPQYRADGISYGGF